MAYFNSVINHQPVVISNSNSIPLNVEMALNSPVNRIKGPVNIKGIDHSLTHLLTYSLTYLLTHLLTYSLTYLLTYSLTYVFAHSFIFLLTH